MEYLRVTKPRIVALFAVTVLAALLLAGPPSPAVSAAVLCAAALTVAGAAAMNGALEYRLDARMERTRRRPVASGAITPRHALLFGLALTAAGVVAVLAVGGALAAAFAAAGAAYYVVVYTLWIKPHTGLSSIPGGLAGVFPVLIAWAAAGAPADADIAFVCLLIVAWSPPHFWALAYARETEFAASGIPVPPVVYGDRAAGRQLLVATAVLVGITFVAAATLYGWLFWVVALAGGAALLAAAALVARRGSRRAAWTLHKLSGPYLALLLAAVVVERLL